MRPSGSSKRRSIILPAAGSDPSRRGRSGSLRGCRGPPESRGRSPLGITSRHSTSPNPVGERIWSGASIDELKLVNPEAYFARIFRRVRGRGMPDETDSLISGTTETLSVLFLDIQGSTSHALDTPPEVVLMSLNQMMANAISALRNHDARVSVFRGDGFMAMFRGQYHATRAVAAALELCRLNEEYNEPRVILGLKPFAIRIGVSTGDAVLGNVGTYDLMDYTAIGTTVNLGARARIRG